MPKDLRNLPIAITGASSGIGMATAVACARAGMPVALGARREDKLERVAEQIRREGGRAIVVRTNVDSPADCEALVERTIAEFGSIYSVFANAGYGADTPIAPPNAASDADIRAMFETNFFGTLNTIRPALPHMLKAGRGHVLICSSCLSKFALPWHTVYSATKAAQDHIGRGLLVELKPRGIAVSTVHPIGTTTEFFEQSAARSHKAAGAADGPKPAEIRTPRFMMQPPETVANAIVKSLRKPRGEVWTSLPVRLAFATLTAFPGLRDAVTARKYARP
ncbi:MAG TPA: SDR family NAD(P)-dependent oxidoreductase [Phycisphaerales bacterium]|nr:SDR family NAD(P)-dependent oxidoreductase [Phycisphaerales bacterium]